eukprot:TRINITY_DN97917_c0_g1_i1.p1 TRINITY_DN97917_c0_g1~~TRINITY_DN97917_c0_g1_i1.p1  ORF type:complete len:142 (-),score=12.79 TRINITY_DN97917_c0_g1_i1:60-428(-)
MARPLLFVLSVLGLMQYSGTRELCSGAFVLPGRVPWHSALERRGCNVGRRASGKDNPLEDERRNRERARTMLSGTPVDQMAGGIGESGANALNQVLLGLFALLCVATASVVMSGPPDTASGL